MRNVERAKKIAADKGVNISFVCREIGKSRGYISQMLPTDRDFPDEMLSPVASQKENPPQQPQSEVDAAVERIRRKLESMPKEQREALMNLIEKM